MGWTPIKYLPSKLKKWIKAKYSNFLYLAQLKQINKNHSKALKAIREKEKINVAFFLIHESVWKYEELYNLMREDIRFNPIVVICPYISVGDNAMHREMSQTYNSFIKKRYNVIKSFDKHTGKWIKVRRDIKPDIIFFTNPWPITKSEYLISKYDKVLTCYVPYGFKNSYLYNDQYNQPIHNLVWKFFLETEVHKKLSIKYSRNKSANTVVTGAPGMDTLLRKDYVPLDVWKIKDRSIKRIIWAPHHTIPGMGANLDYSTFINYHNFMFEIADKYKNQIQIAFKPHPLLRAKLASEQVWGKEKTDNYYNKWAELSNGQLNEGDYIDLFSTSDGMIHDSASFIIEYLYTQKPVMFLINDDSVWYRLNEIGKMALSTFYTAENQKNIHKFVEETIIGGQDFRQQERDKFFNSVIKPPNNRTASENIFNNLKLEIFGEHV
ncbi:CDP-Glycerol:Poly(glycerophosphate) glycerophosphotransferase [Mariniphaga anaerophila]|uniref:CDP-Glycerol:Poly(Glycerophosphate) glycerophosphotransferase n=1 Tax=Mariniphaga anaerophila TaxID=1484053 RepID=A0A1M5BLU0_9BACT|nr:CDP-glycerol glycerophosphotransferase family protein [Mariniphaga anaerophila]SHF43366.1 CDP-Glycerol:Poly(glycerophosphate) glycerophosphotransferase [Mariniphaga anaerophila]